MQLGGSEVWQEEEENKMKREGVERNRKKRLKKALAERELQGGAGRETNEEILDRSKKIN